MADVTSTLLQLVLQETGNNNNNWGDIANSNFSRIEEAIADAHSVATTGGDTTLTDAQAFNAIILVSGTLTSNANIIVPARTKSWFVKNGTSGSYTVTVKTSGGSGFAVPQGRSAAVFCDGTNVQGCETLTLAPLAPILFLAGSLSAPGLGVSGDTNTGIYSPGTDQLAVVTNGAARQSWDNAGTDITGDMTVSAGATVTRATARPLTLNRTGDTTAQQIELQIEGVVRGILGANATNPLLVAQAGGGTALTIDTSSNLVATGNVSAYSDARLKDEVETIYHALHKVLAMRGVTYRRKDTGARRVGLIAQELEQVIPQAVLTSDEGIKSVAYGDLVGVLVEAVKELADRVMRLEQR